MTTMTRGRLPASVYWRRRVVVLGVSVTLLLMIVNLVRGGGQSDASAGQARQVSAQTTTTATPSSAPSTTTTTATTTTQPGGGVRNGAKVRNQIDATPQGLPQGPVAPTLVAPTGACTDSDVLVAPSVGAATVGQPVPVTLSLRTRKAAACTWHVTASHLAVKVSRFGNEIWSSLACPQQVPITDVVVRQAVVSTLHLSWTSRRADTGCPRVSDWALPGHYRIAAAALGGVPAESAFDLAPRTVVQTSTAPSTPVKTAPTSSPTPGPTPTTSHAPSATTSPSSPPTQTSPSSTATPARR